MHRLRLDTAWLNDPRVIRAGVDGAGLHVACMCLHARFPLGIPRDELRARGAEDALIDRLIAQGLLVESEGLLTPDLTYTRLLGGRRYIPKWLRRQVMERDGFACAECGATDDLAIDHIHPYSRGGPETLDNLRVLCRSCNSRKGAKV